MAASKTPVFRKIHSIEELKSGMIIRCFTLNGKRALSFEGTLEGNPYRNPSLPISAEPDMVYIDVRRGSVDGKRGPREIAVSRLGLGSDAQHFRECYVSP